MNLNWIKHLGSMIKKIFTVAFVVLAICSCKNDDVVVPDSPESNSYLTIGSTLVDASEDNTTRSAGNAFTSSKSNTGWSEGDQMGIWCINTELAHFKIHSDLACSNTIATFTNAGWDIEGARRRLNSPYLAAMFAYYPYVKNYATTDKEVTADSIPIRIAEQHDVIYGSNLHSEDAELNRAMNIAYDSDLINDETEGILSNRNMRANLYMHHALGLVEFRIRRRNYSGLGHIDRAEITDETNRFVNNAVLTVWFDYNDTERYRMVGGGDLESVVKNLPNTKKLPQFEERLRDDDGKFTDEYTPIDLGRVKVVDYTSSLTSMTPEVILPNDTVTRVSVNFFVAPQKKIKPTLKVYFDGEDNPFEFTFDKELEIKAGYRYVLYGRVDGGNYLYFGEPQVVKWDEEINIDPKPNDGEETIPVEQEQNIHLQY